MNIRKEDNCNSTLCPPAAAGCLWFIYRYQPRTMLHPNLVTGSTLSTLYCKYSRHRAYFNSLCLQLNIHNISSNIISNRYGIRQAG